MKKTLIASAVAAATLSTGAFAETAPITISGDLEIVYKNVDSDTASSNDVEDNGSHIGFAHEHALSEDVTAFAATEIEFSTDEDAASGLETVDVAIIGVKGGFGEVVYGIDDSVYDWIDVADTGEALSLGGGVAEDSGEGELRYTSPEIAEGLTVGVTVPLESDSPHAGSLAAMYSMDNLSVAFAYSMGRDEGTTEGTDTIGLGVSFGMDDLTILGQYETKDDDRDYLALQGMYAMGQNQFSLGYAMTSFDASGAEDQTDIYVQALHNLSDNMYVYLEYLMTTDEAGIADADTDTLALGTTYSF